MELSYQFTPEYLKYGYVDRFEVKQYLLSIYGCYYVKEKH